MPLLRFDLIEGRTDVQIATLLDAAHDAMLEAFKVPVRDRYQLVYQHRAELARIEDTGLGIARTKDVMIVSVTTRPRTQEEKVKFYKLLCEYLEKRCGIAPSDVMVNFVSNTDDDWSFGNGEAQFLTGKLGGKPQINP
ncbi:tautomerase family protein [Acetobacter lovaniensis]|jgi:hypothetical protein|uniref:tautomerase family protein n=1 Tax=Acetobacter lovaniensis TaxID=104100 RepID=UPI0020A11C5D|nr:tautomerase family protein [Acetobacter lovaniensis]MCP1240949.1 tautomerase family protein [Acetobacter lovaniensis]